MFFLKKLLRKPYIHVRTHAHTHERTYARTHTGVEMSRKILASFSCVPFLVLLMLHVLHLLYKWTILQRVDKSLEENRTGPFGGVEAFPSDFMPELNIASMYTDLSDEEPPCGDGLYLGPDPMTNDDQPYNCVRRCNNAEYEYRFIGPNDRYNLNGVGISGSWCLLKPTVHCNTNLSLVVFGAGRYECISLYPHVFGGDFGTHIVGCAPINAIIDHGVTPPHRYNRVIPYDLRIDNLDEKLPSGQFRYRCDTKDVAGNEFINMENSKLGSRFMLEMDTCNLMADGYFDIRLQKCACRTPGTQGATYYVSDEPCRAVNQHIVDPDRYRHRVSCSHPLEATFTESRMKPLPCGLKTLQRLKNVHRGQMTALFDITTTYPLSIIDKIS